MLKHERYVVKTKWDKIKENIKGILVAILIALTIRVFLIEPYKIPTPSMYPTILTGDMIMANKFWYGVRVPIINLKLPAFSTPDSGNIILFETPTYESPGKFIELINFVTFGIFGLDNTADNAKYYIKRAVAVPGDILTIYDPRTTNFQYQISVNGEKMLLTPVSPHLFEFPSSDRGENKKDNFLFFVENLSGKKHYVQYIKEKYTSSHIYSPYEMVGNIYIPKKEDVIVFQMLESHDNLAEIQKAKQDNLRYPDMNPNNRVKMIITSQGKTKEVETTGKIIRAIYYSVKPIYDISENDPKVILNINSILTTDDMYELILKGKVEKKINENYYFVMGDNRDKSYDSRAWGLVNHSLLLGSPLFRHFPFGRFGRIDKVK